MCQKISIASALLLLCGLEGIVRLILGIQPTPQKFRLSHQLGWEWNLGYEAVIDYHGDTYRTVVSSQGLRNEEVTIPKPPNVYRIIALGDSITEGGGVKLEKTFVKILGRLLQARTPAPIIEIINASTGDCGTGLGYPQQHWVQCAETRNIPVLDLLPLFRAQSTPDLFYDQVHLKSASHHLVAEAVFNAILASAQLDPNLYSPNNAVK